MCKQKKLMLLGGIYYLKPAIEAAHKLGLYVITADYLPDNPAHKWSDEYVNVSIVDKESVLKIAQEKEIDGILSYAVDPGVVTAAYVADKMSLPNVGPYKSVCILQDKALFRQFLSDNGFNVPRSISFQSIDELLLKFNYLQTEFKWPLIIKPTDSAGSKGVTRVDCIDNLENAAISAFQSSISKKIIVEEFIELDGYQSGSDSFSVNGKMIFTTFDDQRFDKKAINPYAPSIHTWPSTMPEQSQLELTAEIQRLITLLGMRTSLYNIEARVGKDGRTYIMELSPRAGGNRLAEVLCMATKQDIVLECIKASVGLPVDVKEPVIEGYWADVVLHSDSTGIFQSVDIETALRSNIKDITLYKQIGDNIESFSAANAAIGSVFLKFDSKEDMEQKLNNLNKLIKINIKVANA